MAATIDIDRIIEICFSAQYFVYGFMALALYPYNDYDVAQRMKNAVSKRYLHGRRVLGATYLLLGIAAIFGLYPATSAISADWQWHLVPACLTLFFVAHTAMLLGLCDWEPLDRKAHLLRLLPLPVLCAVYMIFPAWGEAVAVLQSIHLVLLIGYYTPLFYKEFAYLNRCCWDAVNNTPDEVACDYDCLPESMPWVGHCYKGLLVIILLALLTHFLTYDWCFYVVAALFVGYLFRFFYWVFLRFPRFSRTLFYYMKEEE